MELAVVWCYKEEFLLDPTNGLINKYNVVGEGGIETSKLSPEVIFGSIN